MMLDLGWQGMQSRFWFGVLSFAGLVLATLALGEGAEATVNKAVKTQAMPASHDAEWISDGGITGTPETALKGIAETVKDGVHSAPPVASDQSSEATSSSVTTDDNYTPTERISEDRSVSFPVDI